MWLNEELAFQKAERDKVCKAANKAISMLQPGSKTAYVAATRDW